MTCFISNADLEMASHQVDLPSTPALIIDARILRPNQIGHPGSASSDTQQTDLT